MSIVVSGVSRRHADRTVLSDVSLELHPGDRVGLIGRNGSGKTTLMRLMAGLEAPDAGSVTCHGRTAQLEQRDRRLIESVASRRLHVEGGRVSDAPGAAG